MGVWSVHGLPHFQPTLAFPEIMDRPEDYTIQAWGLQVSPLGVCGDCKQVEGSSKSFGNYLKP